MLKNIKFDFLKVLLNHALDFEETLQIFKSLFTAYTTKILGEYVISSYKQKMNCIQEMEYNFNL